LAVDGVRLPCNDLLREKSSLRRNSVSVRYCGDNVLLGRSMGSTIRAVLAVIVGFVAASAVMMVVETINGRLLYPELREQAKRITDREGFQTLMASAPAGALAVVLAEWALGSLTGGFVTAAICRPAGRGPAIALGVLLTLAGVANNLMLPPPVWFWIATFLILLPFTLVGAKLAPASR
jgi:hypothetical protein